MIFWKEKISQSKKDHKSKILVIGSINHMLLLDYFHQSN